MHSASIQAPPTLVYKFCTAMIQSGEQQNGDTTRAYSVSCSSKTPDANMRSPYGDTLLLDFVWLVTCVLRIYTRFVDSGFVDSRLVD